jgi:hypothetical protein
MVDPARSRGLRRELGALGGQNVQVTPQALRFAGSTI